MKEVVEISCYLNKDENGKYFVLPRGNLDKASLNTFLDERGRWVNLRLMNKKQNKTYDQTKAFFSLVNNLFQVINGYKPNSRELEDFYREIIPVYFPVRESFLEKGKFVSKHWSELSKKEGMEVIEKVIQELSSQMDIPDEVQSSCKDIFDWLREEKKMELNKENNTVEEDIY